MKVFKTFTLICKSQYNARNGYKKAKNLMFTVCTKNWTLILRFVDGNSIKHMFPACDVCYPTNWQTQNRRCFIWADQQGCTICGVGQSRVALTRPHTLLATDLWWPWKGGGQLDDKDKNLPPMFVILMHPLRVKHWFWLLNQMTRLYIHQGRPNGSMEKNIALHIWPPEPAEAAFAPPGACSCAACVLF